MDAPRLLVLGLAAAIAASGCGSRCVDIAARRAALREPRSPAIGPHLAVHVPLARANALIAEILRDQPLEVPVELPALGPFELAAPGVVAIARQVVIRPASPGQIRFAMQIEIRDQTELITTLAIETAVAPIIEHAAGMTDVVAAFGPANLAAVQPELGPDSGRRILDAIARWLPASVREHLPRAVLDAAAANLVSHLAGKAYEALQQTLLRRLGTLTELRVHLPELPIASIAVRSTPEALVVEVMTGLPIRRGLTESTSSDAELAVRISGSTVAELANWAIDHHRLPAWYTRSLEPRPDGEFRPRFDYDSDATARPFKIHVLQERGGCSYFRIGLQPEVSLVEDKLVVEARDRLIEDTRASAIIEAAVWLKQLVFGAVDSAKQIAAHTTLTIGGKVFATRIIRAAFRDGELELSGTVTLDHDAR